MISGFFGYYRLQPDDFYPHWKRRIGKIAYLYFGWNAVYTVYYYGKLVLQEGIAGIDAAGVCKGILLYEYHAPWWFMLQLLLLELAAPLIWYLLQRKAGRWGMALLVLGLAAMQGMSIFPDKYMRCDAYVWYLLGVYIAYLKPEAFLETKKNEWKTGIILFFLGEAGLFVSIDLWDGVLRFIPILILTVSFCMIMKAGSYKKEFPENLKISFFIYAVHPFFISIFYAVEKRILPINEISSFLLFLINPWLILGCIYVLAILLKKIKLYRILTLEKVR